MMTLLHQARNDLIMQTTGPTNIAIPKGQAFNYFDEIRKNIELSISEVFFIDPYLDAEFVTRYLTHVRSEVEIRLLTNDKGWLTKLLSAVEPFSKQSGN